VCSSDLIKSTQKAQNSGLYLWLHTLASQPVLLGFPTSLLIHRIDSDYIIFPGYIKPGRVVAPGQMPHSLCFEVLTLQQKPHL
jgi:hypothetical protein